MTEVLTLQTTKGIDISWEINAEGKLQIQSNLSEEDTKAIIPQLFPSWMFDTNE